MEQFALYANNKGQKMKFKYDAYGNVAEYVYPALSWIYKYEYDKNGNWIKKIQYQKKRKEAVKQVVLTKRKIVYY